MKPVFSGQGGENLLMADQVSAICPSRSRLSGVFCNLNLEEGSRNNDNLELSQCAVYSHAWVFLKMSSISAVASLVNS